jgi:hypothetical protein
MKAYKKVEVKLITDRGVISIPATSVTWKRTPNMRLGGPQSCNGDSGENKNSQLYLKSNS